MAEQHANPVRRWVHPDDFDGALAQRDGARREAKKFERRWKKAEQKLAEVERMLGARNGLESSGWERTDD